MIAAGDELIESIGLYRSRHWLTHYHIAPFIPFYLIWAYLWIIAYGVEDYFEPGLIVLAIIAIIQIFMGLSCLWSVHVMAAFTSTKVKDPKDANAVKVVPTANNGSSEIIRIFNGDGETWIIFQKLKYIWKNDKKRFEPVEFPSNESFNHYLNWKGYETDDDLNNAQRHFGNNKVDMTIPEFGELFKERAIAPFFVFQVFCVGLWCLDEYWYYSVFTLFMLVVFESTLVTQQIRNMSEIRKMGNKPYMIQTYRSRRWRAVSSDELIAGDIVSIGRSQNDNLIPCDMLLLRGPCIVDESMLTGESVPQMKEAIENVESKDYLDETSDGKLHLLYGGTKIVQHTPPEKNVGGLRAQDNGCVAYVLRTGFNTSQGKLLRTILYGVRRVTANNLETFALILFLLIFAIAAAAYVWIKGTEDPNRNRYKLFLECTLILTSVVPPELPIELSLAVNQSLISLTKLMIFCTEPFRIPFAGKLEICCFDKTGTLTSDNLIVEGVAGVSATEDKNKVVNIEKAPIESIRVLATCHSLVQLDDGIVGDPLEKATLKAIDWNLTKGDAVIPKKGKYPGMKIFYRHHFSSALKRMSVIAGYNEPGSSTTNYISAVKGAPETLKPMFKDCPNHYDETYLKMSRRGARVLALGWKELGNLTHAQTKEMTRDELECSLKFAGFVVISCPLKEDSKEVIKEIVNSSHHVTMITGDNPLTACHVARELGFMKTKTTLVLTNTDQQWQWISIDERKKLSWKIEGKLNRYNASWLELTKKNDLCLTGDGLVFLQSNPELFRKILPHIKVYARVAPKQKELIITSLKNFGYCTLMCGDGTNDVGALKHADVGVAILSNMPAKVDKKKKKKEEDEESKKQSVSKRPLSPMEIRERKLRKQQEKIQEMLKDLEKEQQVVKLGDASVAAPFTAKTSSCVAINHIIKQGRCTLVTTLQMLKILALNALILAYSQSVLYLEGVKFSDGQATLQGILLAACFLFISRSKPLKTLSKTRPLPNIFNLYTLSTVLLQFAVHFGCLFFLVQEAYKREPKKEEFPDLDKEFEPNLLNSTVYMISMTLQLSTLAINYRGYPFMESLRENKALLYSLTMTAAFIVLLALGWIPEASEQFGIVDFPQEFRVLLIQVLAVDFFLSLILDRLCLFIFGEGKLKTPE